VRRPAPFLQIAEALVEAGYRSLDAQAKALGIHRSTAWTIIKAKHKLGRLHTKTTQKILENLSVSNIVPALKNAVQKRRRFAIPRRVHGCLTLHPSMSERPTKLKR